MFNPYFLSIELMLLPNLQNELGPLSKRERERERERESGEN